MTSSAESARIAPDPSGPFLGSARPPVRRYECQTTDATRASLVRWSGAPGQINPVSQSDNRFVEFDSVSDSQNSAEEARVWVGANPDVVYETYQRFLHTGEWPTVGDLQRHFDRADMPISVQQVVDTKPRVLNEARPVYLDYLTLQLRHLMWIAAAKPMVTICVRAVQRAVDSYLSDVEEPFVSTQDDLTQSPSRLEGDFSSRVYKILTNEYPSPFGGSSVNGDQWRIEVDARFVRQFRDVENIEDLVARQDAVRAEIAAQVATMAATFPLSRPIDFAEAIIPESVLQEVVAEPEQEPILFISWSRGRSRTVAEKLVPLLEARLPGVEVFFSPISIEPGTDPSRRLFDEGLLRSSALLVVLTPSSASSAYVIWETASAWALKKLVIPLFVEIEPADVPGPLIGKVQGVHLSDRNDVDRAIRLFAIHFGVVTPEDLSDEEYQSLLVLGYETASPSANDSRADLTRQLRGYVAKWQALFDGFQGGYEFKDRSRLAAEIQQVLVESVRIAATNDLNSGFAEALAKVAARAGEVGRIHIYLDGGLSFNSLNDGCRELIEAVRGLLT